MKAVGEQFVFEVNLRGVRVGEGVDGHVQVKGNFGDGARNREEPFQHAGVFGGAGGAKRWASACHHRDRSWYRGSKTSSNMSFMVSIKSCRVRWLEVKST